MRGRIWLAGLLASALGLAGLAACHHARAGGAARPGGVGGAPASGPGAAAASLSPEAAGSTESLTVRRGELRPRLLLTGELKAAQAQGLVTPATPSFQVQITWMAEDGAAIAGGQPVVQFDNTTFVQQLEEKRAAASAALAELARLKADARAKESEKVFTVEQKRAGLAKARTAAAVPRELLPLFDYQDHQLKLQGADNELAKAEKDLLTERGAAAADLAVQRIALEKARRDLAAAEAAIRDLTLRAPRAGTVVIAEHPWEGRKVQVGDSVWAGVTVATLPDLSSMIVEAALSDADDGRVTPGMEASCFLDAYPDTALAGRVSEVAVVARESGRSALLRYFPVRVELARPSPRQAARLRPGMSVRVEIAAAPVRDALLVPRVAIDLAASPPRALLGDGRTVALRLGACDALRCVAESGVVAGQALRRRGAGSAR